jgi:hypothetical protein
MGYFDDIIKAVPAEDRAVLDKYPQLKQSMDQLETRLGQVAQYADQWASWAERNWDPDANMTRAERTLRTQIEELNQQIETAQQAGSGASSNDIAALRKEFSDKVAQLQNESARTVAGLHSFYQAHARHMLPHKEEFGENLDPAKFQAFIQQNLNQPWAADPDLAYERMVAEQRQANAAKRAQEQAEAHQREIEQARADERQKVMQEHAMGPQGVLPTDSTGGIAGVTSLTQKPATMSDELKAKLGEAKLGDGSLAAMGYEMYRRGELPVQ